MTIDWTLAPKQREPLSLLNLGKREREATPLVLARSLVNAVNPHAVLWVATPTVYSQIPGLDLWDVARDAHLYNGPGPIIAHPPCGPWGKYRHVTVWDDASHGVKAMELVHKFGGVVEQPFGSSLFRTYAKPTGSIVQVNQFDYGHRSLKPTLLYFHRGGM